MTVLIAEDDPGMSVVIARMIEPLTKQIVKVSTLRDCMIELARTPYTVVVLDLKMPDSPDGKDAIGAIKTMRETGARVVVISGMPDPGLKEECEQAGADAFIPKTDGFTRQAVLVAINVAASVGGESFSQHVELLDSIVHTAGK